MPVRDKKGRFVAGIRGDVHPNWKGMQVGYMAKHRWIWENYGKASKCISCNRKGLKYEWANKSGKYLRAISDYEQLCKGCHRRKDYGDFCKRGHVFDEKNTRIDSNGHRVCKTCLKIRRSKKL